MYTLCRHICHCVPMESRGQISEVGSVCLFPRAELRLSDVMDFPYGTTLLPILCKRSFYFIKGDCLRPAVVVLGCNVSMG